MKDCEAQLEDTAYKASSLISKADDLGVFNCNALIDNLTFNSKGDGKVELYQLANASVLNADINIDQVLAEATDIYSGLSINQVLHTLIDLCNIKSPRDAIYALGAADLTLGISNTRLTPGTGLVDHNYCIKKSAGASGLVVTLDAGNVYDYDGVTTLQKNF